MRALTAAMLLALVAGCVDATMEGDPTTEPVPWSLPDLVLRSAAFADGEAIPVEHTCDGANTSPPLRATGGPVDAVSLALLVIDSDVPTPVTPLREVVHWVAWNVPLVDGNVTFPEDGVPEGTRQHEGGWRGPCPPQGSPPHRYVFTAHALDTTLDVPEGGTREEVGAAMEGHVLDTVTLTGTYARQLTSLR